MRKIINKILQQYWGVLWFVFCCLACSCMCYLLMVLDCNRVNRIVPTAPIYPGCHCLQESGHTAINEKCTCVSTWDKIEQFYESEGAYCGEWRESGETTCSGDAIPRGHYYVDIPPASDRMNTEHELTYSLEIIPPYCENIWAIQF